MLRTCQDFAHLRSPNLSTVVAWQSASATTVVRDSGGGLADRSLLHSAAAACSNMARTCARHDLTRTPPHRLGEARAMRKLTATLLRFGIRRCDSVAICAGDSKSLVRLRLARVWPLFGARYAGDAGWGFAAGYARSAGQGVASVGLDWFRDHCVDAGRREVGASDRF